MAHLKSDSVACHHIPLMSKISHKLKADFFFQYRKRRAVALIGTVPLRMNTLQEKQDRVFIHIS